MKTNEAYSLIVELYNREYNTWQRQQTYVNETGMWLISNNTTKYQYIYGGSNILYYTKTLIKFKKTSSSPPIFVYFTVHFDDKGGDMNTYPKEFNPEVYDAHEAFEIDKTKMKMLVPLDMNGKQLMNVNLNLNLKFGDIFKIIKCGTRLLNDRRTFILVRKDNNQIFSFSFGVYINSITFHNKQTFDKDAIIRFIARGL